MQLRKAEEASPGVGIPQGSSFTTEEGMKEEAVGAGRDPFNDVIGKSIWVNLLVLNGASVHQVLNRPLVDVATVVQGAADYPKPVIDGVAEESLLGINYGMIRDNPNTG